jgi:putative spermidine/putrescine transport system permease protein
MKRKRQDFMPWLLVGPALLALVGLFVIPLMLLFLSSLEKLDTTNFKIVDRFTIFNYGRLLFDRYYVSAFLATFRTSILATAICLVLAYPVAVYLSRARKRERELLVLLLLSPLLVSIVIRTFGWLIILGPGGVLSAASKALGFDPVSLMYTETAVVIGLAHVAYPVMVLALYNALQNVDADLAKAAQNLGATPFQAFWQITFPLTFPGMLGGTLIVFALSAGSFVIPNILGGPWVKTAAFLIWDQTVTTLDWPFAAAIGLVLLVVTALAMSIYQRLIERTGFMGSSL